VLGQNDKSHRRGSPWWKTTGVRHRRDCGDVRWIRNTTFNTMLLPRGMASACSILAGFVLLDQLKTGQRVSSTRYRARRLITGRWIAREFSSGENFMASMYSQAVRALTKHELSSSLTSVSWICSTTIRFPLPPLASMREKGNAKAVDEIAGSLAKRAKPGEWCAGLAGRQQNHLPTSGL